MTAIGDKPLLLFGGKGGVGKTTLAAATALRLSGGDDRVLLVSTDPAHSTSDLLGTALGPEPTDLGANLWAMEIDAAADARAYVDGIRADAQEAVSKAVLPALERHLELAVQAPGTTEAALFDRFAEVMTWADRRFDRIVFDTAPTGHTLRLLALPDMLGAWIGGLQKQREKVTRLQSMWRNMAGTTEPEREDRVLARLRQRAERFRAARGHLHDDTVFHPVLTAERLPIEETARLIELLDSLHIAVGRLYVNRLLPAQTGSQYMRQRLAQQSEYLDEIRRRFANRTVVTVEQAARDIHSRERLAELAARLG